jgi:phage/plasmid-like protein (TIGR03299 family)
MSSCVEQMAYFGVTPWHKLGTRLDHVFTATEGIVLGGLDWEVKLEELKTPSGFTVPHARAVTRSTDKRFLGLVSDRYQPLQNRDCFRFFDKIVGSDQAIYHTVGSLQGGRKVWLLAKLPGTIKVVGEDVVDKFILLSNSHDGSMAVRGGFTGIRVVCQNTLAMALGDIRTGFTIQHRGDFSRQFEEAIRGMGLANTYFQRMEDTFGALAHVSIDQVAIDHYIGNVFPLPKDELVKKLGEDKWQALYERQSSLQTTALDKIETGAGLKLPGVYGTLWGAYNAVVETVDWDFKKANQKHLHSIWFGDGANVKKRALGQALALVKN